MSQRENIQKSIVSLNNTLINAQTAYYGCAGALGDLSPVMSDADYDALEAQLTALVNANKEFAPLATVLSKVGTESNSVLRIPHARPMLSIENYYTPESFVEAAKNYGSVVLIEPKRDGCSSEIQYLDGVLTRAVSRGDGEAGEEMTAQVKVCKKIPQTIKTNIHDLRIRGEMVMYNSELSRINSLGGKQYANSRNLTAGTLKQKDLSIVRSREIVMIPWDMYSPDQDALLPDSAYERMQLATSFGFADYEGERVNRQNSVDILNVLKAILKKNEVSTIVADGAVIKSDSHKVRNTLGVASKFTKYQHCFKPQNLVSNTTLLSIEYGLGRTGKVTPVAILKPVNLGGAMIARATVCNETYMEALNLTIGCEVELCRSGDVIPFIVKVTKPGTKKIVFPTNCPSCNSVLTFDPTSEIVQRMCVNSNCAGKAAEQFAYVGNRKTLEVDNLGDSMAAELVVHNITNLADLFEFAADILNNNLTVNDLVDMGFRSGVNTMKMIKSLQNAKTAKWDRWIASLNIPFIGHSLGKDIAKILNLSSDDMNNLPKLLLTLPKLNLDKLGVVKTASIVEWAQNPTNADLCNRLYNTGVRPEQVEVVKMSGKKLSGTKFVMTGEMARGTRKVVAAELVNLGAEELSAVSSACNLLIVGENPGSKLAKAQAKNIKIVGEDWVNEMLG